MSRVNESKNEKSDADGSPKRPRAIAEIALPSSSNSPVLSDVISLPTDENNHKYVGLVNQAMTCYLNSLVQSLYMTPEFRNAMYEWEYVSSQGNRGAGAKRGESSIPCQLQKLFLLLQTTDSDSLETRDLTASFGWHHTEAYDQHDVQELCRKMFDALEHKWKGTKHEKLIQDLYRGTMEDVVKCSGCGNESIKPDYFFDLPLAVKPFGATSAFKSVEEALRGFVQPELLDGSNQYYCETCKEKQDAHKGLRILQFPYLLTIQLKRFDFDYNTMNRIKLNDRVTFPDVLDLNSYIYRKEDDKDKENGKTEEIKRAEQQSEERMEVESPPAEVADLPRRNPYIYEEKGEVRVGQTIDKDAVDELLKNGENVFELFSVMVHSGNASGGHYYAYIKNLEQDKWFSFNDARVDFASISDIERSFGGNPGGWNTSNTNAYMLMYRKVDRKLNQNFVHTDRLPKHIRNLQDKWKIQEQEEEEQRKVQQSLLKVEVRINYPIPSVVKSANGTVTELMRHSSQIENDFVEYVTEISRDCPIQMVFSQARSFFNERAKTYGITFPLSNIRLIHYERGHFYNEYISKADLNKPLRSLFDPSYQPPPPLALVKFLMDCRIAPSPFPITSPGGRMIKVQRVDIGKRTIAPEYFMYIARNQPMLRAKEIIGNQFGDEIHAVCHSRLVLEVPQVINKFLQLNMMNTDFCKSIDDNCGELTPTLYYDGGLKRMCSTETAEATEVDRKAPFESSAMFKILERKHFSSMIRVRFPPQEEIARAATRCETDHGPTWVETEWFKKKEEVPAKDDVPDDPLNVKTGAEQILMDDDICESGRVSTASMRSASVNDLDEISGSFCNNTPQMSPSVSEADEYDVDGGFNQQNQLNADRMLDYMADQMIERTENDVNLMARKAWKGVVEDNASESQSMASSGQSTVVPSTSTASASNEPTDYLDGKIVVVSMNDPYRQLDVDNRLTIGEFKQWIASEMGLDKNQFVLCSHRVDDLDGYELQTSEEKSITSLGVDIVAIKLRPPLKQNEKMMPIVLFDMNDENRENWKTLFEIPVSPQMYIGDIMLKTIRMYNDIYGEQLEFPQIRLRNISSHQSNLKTVLNPHDTFENSGSLQSMIYMQIISDESLIGKPGDPIFVRRFRPSTTEVGPIREVLVDPREPNQALAFLQSLSDHSKIPVERLAISDINLYFWGKWPFARSRLELLDHKTLFVPKYHEYTGIPEQFISKAGCKVIYYKDIEEQPKILSDEERKQIRIKENGQNATSNRRKERPLRIQMSSVSEA